MLHNTVSTGTDPEDSGEEYWDAEEQKASTKEPARGGLGLPIAAMSSYEEDVDFTRPHPRVNGELLPLFIGQHVSLPCHVEQRISPTELLIHAADGRSVRLFKPKHVNVVGPFVDLIVRVLSSNSARLAYRPTELGGQLDMETVDMTIRIMHAFPDFFLGTRVANT